MTEQAEQTLEQLQAQFAKSREDRSISAEDVLKLALQVASAEKLEVKKARDVANAAAKAEHEKVMAQISPLLQVGKDALDLFLSETRDKLVKAGIHGITLAAKDLNGEMLVSVKASGPGLPTASKGRGAGTGERRGRNVYTKDGTEYTTRELLAEFGPEHYGDKALEAVGMSHRADQLAETIGATKTKRENGDS